MTAQRGAKPKRPTRAVILDSAGELMREQGYAAVTYRSVATRAGVTPGLVQYYFPNLDELFMAMLREATDRILQSLAEAAKADQPLRAAWEYANNPAGTALLLEFMALANHRKDIGAVIGEGGERVRQAQLARLREVWAHYDLPDGGLSPEALLFLMSAIPRMAHLEESFGTRTGHAEAIALVERFLDRVEPRPRRRTQ